MSNILVIDDDDSICNILRVILEGQSCQVDVAHTGEEAIQKSNEKLYDAAFIDFKLPDKNGIELLTRLRDPAPKMVKIMITGYPSADNEADTFSKGADAYVKKPFDPGKLLVILNTKLQARKAETGRLLH